MRTWPPGALGAWYSSLSFQLIISGSQAGTVAANRPPGLSTRTISPIAATSSWMCSSTSDVMTTSNVSSGKGSVLGVAAQHAGQPVGGDLACLDHRRQRVARLDHLVGGVVEGDDAGAAPSALVHVTPEAGADVEHGVARLEPELVESDGEHQSAPVAAQLGDVLRHRQHLAVLLDGELGATRPRPALEHTATAGFADGGAQLGVGEGAPDRRRQVAGVALAAPEHGVAVGAGDLGQRATVGGDERCAGAHRLDRREAEALVEAGHDRQLGLAVELDDALVGHARTRSRCSGVSPNCSIRSIDLPGLARPMTVSVMSSPSARSLAIASIR